MGNRRQEKVGWVGGLLGGFVVVLIMSLIALFRGMVLPGSIGLLIFAAACGSAAYIAPWRYPRTRYWLLLVPYYVLLCVAVGWGIWVFGAKEAGFHSWGVITPIFVVLLPLWTIGRQRWVDQEIQTPDDESPPVK